MTAPPPIAELVLTGFVADRDTRDAVLGDLAEEHAVRCAESGAAAAARWYWRQTIASLPPLAGASLRRARAGGWARVAIAVVAGYAALVVLGLAGDAGLGRLTSRVGAPADEWWRLMASLALGGAGAVSGGWVAAAVGRRAPLASAAALGAACVAINLTALFAGASSGPLWYWLSFGVYVLPGTVAGGLLRLRQLRGRRSSHTGGSAP
ncbi:MAG TPA: permease prefix domain 2-containing transporter [Gemmatimonadaceae bacterium]|nr:permease prefix domain 2-containing transporter [Gemmatimonadaceae bacterium]